MSVLKWILIIFGVLFLIIVAAIVGVSYWASTVEGVKLTQSDLEIGGSYPADERQVLLDACQSRIAKSKSDEGACTCIADKAGAESSRLGRLGLIAIFEGSATKGVALVKGLIDLGMAEPDADAMWDKTEKSIQELMTACGLKK